MGLPDSSAAPNKALKGIIAGEAGLNQSGPD